MRQFFLGLGLGLGLAATFVHGQGSAQSGSAAAKVPPGSEPWVTQTLVDRGLQFNVTDDGPNFGKGLAGVAYRKTAELFADPALVFRANAYAWETDDPKWLATLTGVGLAVGLDSEDRTPYAQARLHVRRGAIRIDEGSDESRYVELWAGPSPSGKMSLWVKFPSGKMVRVADEPE